MFDAVLVVVYSCLLLALEHYLPWRQILRKELPVVARYTMGVLALIVPVSVVWIIRADWVNLIMVWAVVLFGGGTVYLLYVVDRSIEAHGRADIAEQEGRYLRGQADQRD
jgi:hypothetical protein